MVFTNFNKVKGERLRVKSKYQLTPMPMMWKHKPFPFNLNILPFLLNKYFTFQVSNGFSAYQYAFTFQFAP